MDADGYKVSYVIFTRSVISWICSRKKSAGYSKKLKILSLYAQISPFFVFLYAFLCILQFLRIL
jgi:hypothetical protein